MAVPTTRCCHSHLCPVGSSALFEICDSPVNNRFNSALTTACFHNHLLPVRSTTRFDFYSLPLIHNWHTITTQR
eukprot:m.438059 g.438059  ORF g.438059 m.438059 type:complete len:74 (+) comp18187_c0_seq1:1327-1548(+)